MMEQPALFALPKPSAVFSGCERYRYLLRWPTGNQGERIVLFVMANPSTATAEHPDPTVNRCIDYARQWGFAWLWVVNVRAWRETDPDKVPDDPLAIGPDTDIHILQAARAAELVVCGWGKLGDERGHRSVPVLSLIRLAGKVPHALTRNQDGSPGHPLYLKRELKPVPMEGL